MLFQGVVQKSCNKTILDKYSYQNGSKIRIYFKLSLSVV